MQRLLLFKQRRYALIRNSDVSKHEQHLYLPTNPKALLMKTEENLNEFIAESKRIAPDLEKYYFKNVLADTPRENVITQQGHQRTSRNRQIILDSVLVYAGEKHIERTDVFIPYESTSSKSQYQAQKRYFRGRRNPSRKIHRCSQITKFFRNILK